MKSPEPKHPDAPFEWWYEHDFEIGIVQGLRARKLHEETTPYQEMQFFEHPMLGRFLVLDGIVQTTQYDEFIYPEMLTHVPLLGRPRAAEQSSAAVLIIGGGDGGMLREVQRHDWVERIVMIEIDEAVVHRTRELLGFNGDYDDPRLDLRFADGAAFMGSEEVRKAPFDVIIIDATDPKGPSEVLYTHEFFRDVKSCLLPGGATVRHLGVPGHQRQELFPHGVGVQADVFGNAQVYRAAVPAYMGGDMAFVLSSRDGEDCSRPLRQHSGRYYTPRMHEAAFALPPMWSDLLPI